jgi:hypothetical protein
MMGVVDIDPKVLAPLGMLCTHATPSWLTLLESMDELVDQRVFS